MRMTKIKFNFDYKKQEIKKGEIRIRKKKVFPVSIQTLG